MTASVDSPLSASLSPFANSDLPAVTRSPSSSAAIEVVEGNLTDVHAFQEALRGVDVLFHTAAYFRDSYKGGGRHWDMLHRVNVVGTEALLAAAYEAGVLRVVHTSSGGVLDGPPGH